MISLRRILRLRSNHDVTYIIEKEQLVETFPVPDFQLKVRALLARRFTSYPQILSPFQLPVVLFDIYCIIMSKAIPSKVLATERSENEETMFSKFRVSSSLKY